MRKVLNLYAGLGGNRRLWKDCEVTAVDTNEQVLEVYKKYNPNDKIIIGDAHEYLLNHFKEYDFIWSSPPCQSHSKMMKGTRHYVIKYADMSLYQQIILLQNFSSGGQKWVIENVKPYYKPLINPSFEIDRHFYWTNFSVLPLKDHKNIKNFIYEQNPKKLMEWLDIYYDKNIYMPGSHDPCTPLRNCVHPKIGLHIFNESQREGLFNINDL